MGSRQEKAKEGGAKKERVLGREREVLRNERASGGIET